MTNFPIKHVCFDLDGTLINSYQTILKATLKALRNLNISNTFNEEEFRIKIGHHFVDVFEHLKIPVKDFEQFIKIYKSFYFEFINDSKIYPGVFEIMDYLKENKIVISLLTTKNQEQADKIIDYFNLRKYFSYVMGRREGFKHKPSPESLLFICEEMNVKPSETIIVGDTELDINCGKNAGSKTCAVLYGYRNQNLLQRENPDYLILELSELKNIFQKK